MVRLLHKIIGRAGWEGFPSIDKNANSPHHGMNVLLLVALASLTRGASRAIKKEFKHYEKNQVAGIKFAIDEENMRSWYFVFTGEIGTEFEGGEYFGSIKLPMDYPSENSGSMHRIVKMITPNGRFYCGVDICIFNFHKLISSEYMKT